MKYNKKNRTVLYPAMVLLVALWQPFAVRAADCEPQLLADVRVHITPDGRLYLPATIGDREVYFLLSMGSGLPMLLEPAVKSLGLTVKPLNGTGTFSSGVTHFARLEGLKVGDFRFASRAAPIIPQPGAEGPPMLEGRMMVGRIGSTLFERVDVELNLAERQLKLFEPFRCLKRSPVYWSAEAAALPMHFDQAGALIFNLELNGRKVEAGMLSDSRDSTIDVNAAREFFGFDENSPDTEVVEARDGSPRRVFHAMSLTGPALQMPAARVQLRPGGKCKLTASRPGYGAIGYSGCVNAVPFNLGLDLLSQMRVYVSSQRKLVFVTFVPGPSAAN